MSYSERLHIPWWWIVLGLLFVASVGVAVIAYLELWLAIAVIVLSLVAVGLGLQAYSRTLLRVDSSGFTAGRYRLEHPYVGEVTPLEGEAARVALGPESDHRSFLFTRPYISGLVRIDVRDDADPHSCWMVSTRRPQELADALSGEAAQ